MSQVASLQVMHIHIVASCSMIFSTSSREILINERVNVISTSIQSVMPYLLNFVGINVMKGQRNLRSINYSSTVNKSFHLYFH